MDELLIRKEGAGDADAIRAIHDAAFDSPVEGQIVDLLRGRGQLAISLVAERAGHLVGHIAFSPATIEGCVNGVSALGLAPVAVLPSEQRSGIGAKLVEAGLDACRASSIEFVIVLGEPTYYQRFGFERASGHGLRNEYRVDEPFMVLELTRGTIPAAGGLVRYAPEFAEVEC